MDEWDELIERLRIGAEGDHDQTITPEQARLLLSRIGALQVYALERLGRDFAEAVVA